MIEPLRGTVAHYPWGDTEVIAGLHGRAPDGRPWAEWWLGAHPQAPARVPSGRSLEELIAADPDASLGRARHRFGDRLPFLVKVLAAARPLSLQAHPRRDQAAEGFAREEAAGLARDDPRRNYRDDNHKPELICALGRFRALCGFRPVEQTVALLDALRSDLARRLDAGAAGPSLAELVRHLLTHPDPGGVVSALAEVAATHDGPWAAEAAQLVGLAELHPGDPGVAVALLLNLVELAPGEALYLGAGNLHAYLGGVGVELMAASDNVIRGGLTSKHVEVAELLRVLDPTPVADPRLVPISLGQGGLLYRGSAPDFALERWELAPDQSVEWDQDQPSVLLATEGAPRVVGEGVEITVGGATAAWVPADERHWSVLGPGVVFRATVGE